MNDTQLLAVLEEKRPASVRYATVRDVLSDRKIPFVERKPILLDIGAMLGGTLVKGRPDYWIFPDGNKAKFDRIILSNKGAIANAFVKARG
mgnify:CR=1 FL=1